MRDPFLGLWHCLRIYLLFAIWNLNCKYLFDQDSSSVFTFVALCRDEVRHQLLAKGALLIKDAQKFDPIVYFDFIYTLVSL